ncbi:MAG: PAS domain-containing sensor histidine kinase [Cyanobacteria bacterium]|nr:PAS domain-containing sensor histidine kinase [Cyanobacteriota bacterium]MDA0865949.1 PAS domain-containing sensor histidine kinase [Cyanobacteriota bacterium]
MGIAALLRPRWLRRVRAVLKGQRQPVTGIEQPVAANAPWWDGQLQAPDYRALLHQAPIGYIQVDGENQLVWCNATASRLLGIAYANQAMADTPRLLLEWVRSYELDQLIEKTRQTNAPRQGDWVLNLVSPDPFHPSEGVAYPLRGYGLPLSEGQVGVFLENRQEIVTLRQERDRWTSDVAHELKTPLTSIRLVTETLRSRVEPALHSWFDRLLNETLRLSNLVEDLLNLSRLDSADGASLTLKRIDLAQLIVMAWQSLEPLAQVKSLELVYEGPTELPVTLDEALIHRVLINLMDNAIKYSHAHQRIVVRTSIQDTPTDIRYSGTSTVQVDIIDHGAGFKETDLPYIFSRFYRADPARVRLGPFTASPTGQGGPAAPVNNSTGLGLAIVQQIVDAHRGHVTAQNHPQTGGGWLTLTLPLQAAPLPLVI